MQEGSVPPFHVALGRQMRLSSLGSDEALHWRQLVEIVRALTRVEGVDALLQYFLTATLELLEADRGHVRLLNEASGEFEVRAQHGFDELAPAQLLRLCDSPLHRRVLRTHGRARVEDIENSALFDDAASREILSRARCRGGQATPLLAADRRIAGVLTTYTEVPSEPDGLQLRLLDVLCFQLAELLERANEREALLAAARRKDEFLATLAHELRNSIAPLRTSLEILKLASLEHPLHARARAILDRGVDHTTRLIDDLMDASRIARGKLQLQNQPIVLAGLLESAVEAVGPTMREFKHELTTTLPDRDVMVEGDSVRLTQVFVNLLSNAAKYTPGGGRIHLQATKHGGGVQVEVQDNGIGILPEALPHLFEMFSQAALGESRRGGGLGIGLALVKNVVEMHGGVVAVTSPGRNQGSTFAVWLPTLSTAESRRSERDISATTAATRTAPHSSTPHLRVLVVDDDVDSTESLAALLALQGHEVLTAYDGQQAIEITSRFYPDLILLDVVMPGMGGLEAAERIRQLPLPRQPEIIELTGQANESEAARESAAGISAQLLKPVELATLQQVVAIAARNSSVTSETGVQFFVNNIDLALTMLSTAKLGDDAAKRTRTLDNARRAYERASTLLKRLKLEPEQMLIVEDRLQRLEAELAEARNPRRSR